MASGALAHVTPEVLRWARESAGYGLEDAASKIGVKPAKLEGAEAGDARLTLRQAEKAARFYERPLAALFVPTPPQEEAQETQFRRLPGAPEPPWPSAMRLLVRRVNERQAAAVELYEALDESPPWPPAVKALAMTGRPEADVAREILGIELEVQKAWRDPQGFTPMREWTDAVEGLGVLVMQDGSMPVPMMRGFAAVHPLVPAIVVNTRDDPRARAFTIIHELGHLYLAALGRPVGPQTERWCDEFAGQVLMPPGSTEKALAELGDRPPLALIDALALTFGVTPRAAAVRASKTGLVHREAIDAAIAEILAREPSERGKGGDYYRAQIGRLGPAFIRLVFNALDSQALTYPAASSLLNGTKVSNFDTLRDYLSRRAERG